MRYVKLPKEHVYKFMEALKDWGTLYAPIKISEKFYDFRKIEDVQKVEFNYHRTIQPPKRFFYPPKETLFHFDREVVEMYEAYEEEGPKVIFGVHSCDIVGLRIMDSIFIDDEPDPYYQRRRDEGN